jgi:uncharacterized protein YegJ (DUF2314 family)
MEKKIDDIFDWMDTKNGRRFFGISLLCFAVYFIIVGVCR